MTLVCIQASPEIHLERKRSQDLGGSQTQPTTITSPVWLWCDCSIYWWYIGQKEEQSRQSFDGHGFENISFQMNLKTSLYIYECHYLMSISHGEFEHLTESHRWQHVIPGVPLGEPCWINYHERHFKSMTLLLKDHCSCTESIVFIYFIALSVIIQSIIKHSLLGLFSHFVYSEGSWPTWAHVIKLAVKKMTHYITSLLPSNRIESRQGDR